MAAALGCSTKPIRKAMLRMGIPRLPAKARPEKNHFWKGGRSVDVDGYVLVKSPDHPQRTAHGYVREHRLVMEAKLGRYLERHEVVDHIDGCTSNNDPSNLRLFARNSEHLRATITGKPHRMTPEGLAKLRAPKSPEHREKIRQGNLRARMLKRAASRGWSESDAPLSR